MCTTRIHNITGIMVENNNEDRFVEMSFVTKNGEKVVTLLEKPIWKLFVEYIKEYESEEENND